MFSGIHIKKTPSIYVKPNQIIMTTEFETQPPLATAVTEDEVVSNNTYKDNDAPVIHKVVSNKSSSLVRDVFEWRRKDLSLLLLAVATAVYVVLQVYHFNFIPLLSYAAIFIFTSAFVWGNLLRLFGKLVHFLFNYYY